MKLTERRTSSSVLLAYVLASLSACSSPEPSPPIGLEPIVGGPCEGCEAVFQGLPVSLTSVARIAPEDEPGQALRITGRVTEIDGAPAPGTIVYAYHTNAEGLYPSSDDFQGEAANRHGRLRAWCRSDEQGRYRFDTVRPAGYPNSDMPQHVHMHVIEPGRCTYYIDDLLFADDPRLTPELQAQLSVGRGGFGVALPERDGDGVWHVQRDIRLGVGIADR